MSKKAQFYFTTYMCNRFDLRQDQEIIQEKKVQILCRYVSVDSTGHVFTIIRDTSTQVEMCRWVVLLMILQELNSRKAKEKNKYLRHEVFSIKKKGNDNRETIRKYVCHALQNNH